MLERSPELRRDLDGVKELGDGPRPEAGAWESYWRKNPVAAWRGGSGNDRRWFELVAERLVPQLPIAPGCEEAFENMTRELVDYRLAQYRRRQTVDAPGQSFACKVMWNKRDPILKLPARVQRIDIPSGDIDVRLPDGSLWSFRLMKEFCNVARPAGTSRNLLPDLMRTWFGLSAGRPGTAFHVRFFPSPDGWCAEPMGQVAELPEPWGVRAFPSLRAAAGALAEGVAEEPAPEDVALPVRTRAAGLFAVRATGDSMDGGKSPIHDGDWLVFRPARAAGLGAIEGRVALLQTDVAGDYGFQVKRVVRDGARWALRSDNALRPSYDATTATVPIASLVEQFRPEDLAPMPGAIMDGNALREKFGIEEAPRTGRVRGHLFIVLAREGALAEPDRVRAKVEARHPGETAFVLAQGAEGAWRYCGVARATSDEDLWSIPEVDFATWRAFGRGREASRRLPDGVPERAGELVDAVLARTGEGGWVEANGRRCRVVGRAARRGVRIDGGPGGFAERTVSLTDIAWVLVAMDDARERGGVVDEAWVNRRRYLEGTPKGATRWIDSGWAMVLVITAAQIPG